MKKIKKEKGREREKNHNDDQKKYKMNPQADNQKRVRVKEMGEVGVWRLAIEGGRIESNWS